MSIEQDNREAIIRIEGKLELMDQKLTTLKDNHLYHIERDMRQLVAKWVDAGKPTPGKKENIEKTLEILPDKNSEEEMEKKLKDLLSMKERNVISDEEYKEMRKRFLVYK